MKINDTSIDYKIGDKVELVDDSTEEGYIGNKTKWTFKLWNGDNKRKWKWRTHCTYPNCNCDRRSDTDTQKLIGYYSGGFGFGGFTLFKWRIV